MKIPKTIIGLDFETYYDADYTLSKMSTTGYVRDKRFKAHGIGVKTNRDRGVTWASTDDISALLHSFDWDNCALLAHNTQFDGFILSHHYNITPAYYYCSLSMARPLVGVEVGRSLDAVAKYYGVGAKHRTYLDAAKGVVQLPEDALKKLKAGCVRDVNLMWKIFRIMLKEFPEPELDHIHHTVRAYVEPVLRVNKTICRAEHKAEVAKKEACMKRVGKDSKTLRSRPQFAQLLIDAGIDPPLKVNKKGKLTYAFAKNDLQFQELLSHPDEKIRDLVEAKLIVGSSIGETRALRMLEHADPALPIFLNYCGAHTFRWSGGDKMNPQNLPRDARLRKAIKPPPGHKLVIIDSAQIEARVNAWLSGQEDLVEAFRNDEDIYSEFASSLYGFEVNKNEHPIERFVGKTCILGLGFQMGAAKLRFTLESGSQGPSVVLEEAKYKEAVDKYRKRFFHIKNQWWTMHEMIRVMAGKADALEYGPLYFEKGGVWMPNEMKMRYPNLQYREAVFPDGTKRNLAEWVYANERKIYGGLVTENVVQSLARIIVGEQLLRLADIYRLVMMSHDEGVFCVPTKKAKSCLSDGLREFRRSPHWCSSLPVKGEGGITNFYCKL